jgi:hypothetical protein
MYFLMLDRLPARAWWLVTAVLLTVLIWYGTVVEVVTGGMSASDWIRDLSNCIGVLALWGLGLRCRILNRQIWQYFLLLDIGVFVFFALIPQPEIQKFPLALLALIYTPYYLGMYTYAFRSDDLWHHREQARPNLARLALVILLAVPFVFISKNIHYSMTAEDRRQRMSAIMGEIANGLRAYEKTHSEYPKSLHSLSFTNSPLEGEILAHIQKFYYYRLADGDCELGYNYEAGGDSEMLYAAKNTHEAQPSAPTNGAYSVAEPDR